MHVTSFAYGKDTYTPRRTAQALSWTDPEHPGDWTPVERTFRYGHTETWWAADASLGFWGPDGHVRLVVATPWPHSQPGTWPPICPAPDHHARPTAHNPRPT